MLEIDVDNRVHLVGPRSDELERALFDEFTHDNPAYAKKAKLGLPTWDEPIRYRTFRHNPDDSVSFPRGGYYRVRAILRDHGVEFSMKDSRTLGLEFQSTIPDHKMELRPYQEEAFETMVRAENCLLRAGTGAGKTTVGFALAARLKLPTIVIVWTGGLFDLWVTRAKKELGLRTSEIGIVRGSVRKLRPLTIAMQQTLAKGMDSELRQTFGMVICDEVQRFAARTLFDAVDPFPAKYRFGISADESRKDKKEFLIYDLFGRVASDITRESLVQGGHVLDVEIRVVPTRFEADWYRGEDFNRLLECMTTDADRNAILYDTILTELEADERVIVLSARREHCLLIDQQMTAHNHRSGFLIGGGDYQKQFRETVEGLQNGRIRVGVGTPQALGQGIDLPNVAVAVVATPLANNKQQFGQVRGRVCRTARGKKSARLIYLWDRAVYGMKHLENLIHWNSRVLVKQESGWIEGKEYVRLARIA